MLPTKEILGILRDNLMRRGSVLPLSPARATAWADGLAIPRGGSTILYTGLMYQLMPSMIALGKALTRFEDSVLNRLTGLGRLANRGINASPLVSLLVKKQDQASFDGILRNIATLLRAASVDFGYLYEEEVYAGALAHDQGLCEAFERQVVRVHDLFRRNGVRRVITVDPHTTNILRSIMPTAVRNDGLAVQSYLEVLAESSWKAPVPLETSLVVHDSCVYARHEGVMEEPRELLRNVGIQPLEPEHSGRATFCCGGPIESLFPGKARSIADKRVRQLEAVGTDIVTMCPVCLVNLAESARERQLSVHDISRWLRAASDR